MRDRERDTALDRYKIDRAKNHISVDQIPNNYRFALPRKRSYRYRRRSDAREAPGATHKKALWFRVYTNQVMCVCPRPRPRGRVSYICPDLPFKGGGEGRVQAATRRSTGRGCRVGGGRVRSLRRSVAVCLPAASSQEAGHRNLVCVHCNILIGLHADFLVGVGHPAGEGTRTKNSRIVAAEVGPGRPSELSSRGRLATPGWSCS